MYIKISKINKIVSRQDLRRIFTFSKPMLKSIEVSKDTQLYFYGTLSEILMAEKLSGEKLVDQLKAELVPVVLEEYNVSNLIRISRCLCIVSRNEIAFESIERLFGSSICCYLKLNQPEGMLYLIEFKEEVEIKEYGSETYTFALEDYIAHLIRYGLYK